MRTRDIQMHAVVFSPDGSGGPGAPKFEVTPHVLNLTWQRTMNLPGRAVFTVSRSASWLDSIDWMQDHIKLYRESDAGLHTIFAGKLIKPSYGGTDVIVLCWDYFSFLQRSRTGLETLYPSKKIGTEIVSPEWTAAKAASNSPFAFVTTGTIEDPLDITDTTPITVNEEFGVSLFNRLFTFYSLAELAMANTSHNVIVEITHTTPHTFNFWKDRSALNTKYTFSYPGNMLPDHAFDQGFDEYVNDIATPIINDTTGDLEEYKRETTDVATTAYRRLQDAVTLSTLIGTTAGATETDQTKAALARQLTERSRLVRLISWVPRQGDLNPFDGWELGDRFKVDIAKSDRKTDLLSASLRMISIAGTWNPGGGEMLVCWGRGTP